MGAGKREKFARFGIATKGFVYCLIGSLTTLTAVGMHGKKLGSSGVLKFLSDQPFGQVLLGATSIGLVGYVFWKMYQAFADLENQGNDIKGLANRLGYLISGSFYGALAFVAIKILLGVDQSSGARESLISSLLAKSYGQWLVGLLGIIFLGKAIYQVYFAYSGKYKNKIDNRKLNNSAKKILVKSGVIGYTARGVVIMIISFLTFRAAFSANSSQAGGKADAFEFLQNEFGAVILVIISIGFIAYGFFMFVEAKYHKMNIQ